MAGKDVLTTRIGGTVKVEIRDASNPRGTLPNYGYVRPIVGTETINGPRYAWHIASGQFGESLTERGAINGAARAIRAQIARGAKGCACVMDCRDCSLSGDWHVHPGDACAAHPDAPGDH